MTATRNSQFLRTISLLVTICLFSLSAKAQYGGGSGEPNYPYLIYTAEQMNAVGANQDDWDKHFILMADIDLSTYTGTDFNIIGYYVDWDDNKPFTGVFDGNGHKISNFSYTSMHRNYTGLFGYFRGHIKDLGLIAPNVDAGTGDYVGLLVGWLRDGTITGCYVDGGIVSGNENIGGLVGAHGVAQGSGYVGPPPFTISNCYSTAIVVGHDNVGGLVGYNYSGPIDNCYAIGRVWGVTNVGGLAGNNYGTILGCFWDIQTSGQATSAGGAGKRTAEMKMASTFIGWGGCGSAGTWTIDEGNDYPRLWWENKPGKLLEEQLSDFLQGAGTEAEPYLIYRGQQFDMIGRFPCEWDKHYKLMADIDLGAFTGTDFNIIGNWSANAFSGVFDGNGHMIFNFTYECKGGKGIGLFRYVSGENALIKDLRLINPNINGGTGNYVGALIGRLIAGTITGCYVDGGSVSGGKDVGGLIGALSEMGAITNCYSTGGISGKEDVGGLVGFNFGSLTLCYNTGTVSGVKIVGGLVGLNAGSVTYCYSTGNVRGDEIVGGLVGKNGYRSGITDYESYLSNSYSTGAVRGNNWVGGLVGTGGGAIASFWDIETSGQTTSDGGTGMTTAEMQNPITFMEAGWDFVGQPDGPSDIWAEPSSGGYPILWWQLSPLPALSSFSGGTGEPNNPYLISTTDDLNHIGYNPRLMAEHFKLINDIDLTGVDFFIIGNWPFTFTGVFDGEGKTISNFSYTSTDKDYIGLLGHVSGVAEIKDLGLIAPNIDGGTGNYVGALIGLSAGTITGCYVESGSVSGDRCVGGLVGYNCGGTINNCYSSVNVYGDAEVGGLVGENYHGTITNCYSTGSVSGTSWGVGGLAGDNYGTITGCFWNIQTSGQVTSVGGMGMTTAEMQTSITFYGWGGWDDEGNGLWAIDEGNDYPRLWWENKPGHVIEPTTRLPTHATSPSPPDGAIHEDTWVSLSWSQGGYAVSHRVYFGDNFDDVNDGTGGTFRGNRTSTSYVVGLPGFAYPDGLVPGTTYYWRIDEVNNIHPKSPCKGDVWSFTVSHRISYNPSPPDGAVYEDTWVSLGWSPGDYAVSHDVYFGDNFDDVNEGVESTFQGNQADTFFVAGFSGFSYPDGLVPGTIYYWRVDEVNDTEPNSPWKGDVWSFWIPPKTAYAPEPADGAEQVNPRAKLSWTAGLGEKLHTVYFGENFDEIDNATGGLPQITTTYDPGPLKLAKTYYWRVDELDGVFTHKGDIWSFTTQGGVGCPDPANGAVDVKQTQILTWTRGVYADSHQVYFGTDAEAVKNADTSSPEYKGSGDLGSESYDPGKLELDTTYYWRIDEINSVNPYTLWIGQVWSFITANFIVVDDFESYNDLDPDDPQSNRIFNTWLDGYNDPTNGSLVGYFSMWVDIWSLPHSGKQSMPFFYDNSVGYSEVTMTLSYPRDWTEEGVGVLSLWFYGDPDNAPEPMYVAVANANGPTALVYHDNPNAVQIETWKEWNIDLQLFADQGVSLTDVDTISIGFGDKNNLGPGGSGLVFFDNIRLYRPAEPEP